MFLQPKQLTPFTTPFSSARAAYYCSEAIPCTYTSGSLEVVGRYIGFTYDTTSLYFWLDVDIPVGGKILISSFSTSGTATVYAADGITKLLEGVSLEQAGPADGISIVNLGTFDVNMRNGNLNSLQECYYGCNRWSTSFLRQWLNSSGDAGSWWVAQDEWDIRPDLATTINGYMSGVDTDLLKVIKKTQVITYPNEYISSEPDITYDYFWPPSLEQMYITPQISGEGTYLKYWKQASESTTILNRTEPYEHIICYALDNEESAYGYHLRSAYQTGNRDNWHVTANGYIYYFATLNITNRRVAPVCVIC